MTASETLTITSAPKADRGWFSSSNDDAVLAIAREVNGTIPVPEPGFDTAFAPCRRGNWLLLFATFTHPGDTGFLVVGADLSVVPEETAVNQLSALIAASPSSRPVRVTWEV